MRIPRWEIWSFDPLDEDDERRIFGTFTATEAGRIVRTYNARPTATRVAYARRVLVTVTDRHSWWVSITYGSGRVAEHSAVGRDVAHVVGRLVARPGVVSVSVWTFRQDADAGAAPLAVARRQGRCFRLRWEESAA